MAHNISFVYPGVGTGAWYVSMGNKPSVFASCLGEGRRGHNLMPERTIQEIARNLHEPGKGIEDVPVERAHTGLSPRLTHVVDTIRNVNIRLGMPDEASEENVER